MTSLLLAGVVGCSNSNQSTDNKGNKKETQNMNEKKMNMSDDEMKKMKSSDNK